MRDHLTIPESGYISLAALVGLSPEKLRALGKVATSTSQSSLNLAEIISDLSGSLEISSDDLNAIAGLLMALNQIRVERNLSPEDVVADLNAAIDAQASADWKSKHLAEWQRARSLLAELFQPNNFFSIAKKTHDLWMGRSASVRRIRLLADLRPVYDEAATSTLALVLTNTLIVEYFDSQKQEVAELHLSLDQDDLATMRSELERVAMKNAAIAKDASRWSVPVLSYGGA
ncbi:MAG TPA: hypothetical protein VM165_20770 [Planctomycetaceae bacterium]|nr:hypothetical protein [Planctomycetaceae bacterium]